MNIGTTHQNSSFDFEKSLSNLARLDISAIQFITFDPYIKQQKDSRAKNMDNIWRTILINHQGDINRVKGNGYDVIYTVSIHPSLFFFRRVSNTEQICSKTEPWCNWQQDYQVILAEAKARYGATLGWLHVAPNEVQFLAVVGVVFLVLLALSVAGSTIGLVYRNLFTLILIVLAWRTWYA